MAKKKVTKEPSLNEVGQELQADFFRSVVLGRDESKPEDIKELSAGNVEKKEKVDAIFEAAAKNPPLGEALGKMLEVVAKEKEEKHTPRYAIWYMDVDSEDNQEPEFDVPDGYRIHSFQCRGVETGYRTWGIRYTFLLERE